MMGSIMRPGSCWNILNLFILAMSILTIDADSDECTTELLVRRDTVYEASPGQELRINCPVRFCNISPPIITWFKIEENIVRIKVNNSNRIKTEWKTIKEKEGESYLLFQNILRNDSGRYMCEGGGSVSHAISITLRDRNGTSTETLNNKNNDTSQSKDALMMYVYSAAGIGAFVVMVIIVSVISMRGCKGKSKKETENENQYMELPQIEQPTPRAPSRQPSPRGSPNPLPSRRSSEKKTQRQPDEVTASGNNEHLYGQTKKKRDRKSNAAPSEEPASVVYAALNHELPPRTGARPLRQVEETEYAAIRLV